MKNISARSERAAILIIKKNPVSFFEPFEITKYFIICLFNAFYVSNP